MGRSEAETFSWPMVQSVLRMRDFLFGNLSQTSFFGEVLAEQAIGIFVGAALPRCVGVGEEDTRL